MVWFDNHTQNSESYKMTLILDSLTENKGRDDLKCWVIYSIEEEPSFDLNKPDIFIKFLDKLKEKFDVSNWDKTREVWKDFNAECNIQHRSGEQEDSAERCQEEDGTDFAHSKPQQIGFGMS